ALRIIHDRGEAEEIAQEVFLQVFDHAEKFDPRKGSGRAWVSQLAAHKALDRRSFLMRRCFYDRADIDDCRESLRGEDDLDAALDDRTIAAILRTAMQELPPKQRNTLESFFFEGHSLREISQRMNETLINTRHNFYRGLEKLRHSEIVLRIKEG